MIEKKEARILDIYFDQKDCLVLPWCYNLNIVKRIAYTSDAYVKSKNITYKVQYHKLIDPSTIGNQTYINMQVFCANY